MEKTTEIASDLYDDWRAGHGNAISGLFKLKPQFYEGVDSLLATAVQDISNVQPNNISESPAVNTIKNYQKANTKQKLEFWKRILSER